MFNFFKKTVPTAIQSHAPVAVLERSALETIAIAAMPVVAPVPADVLPCERGLAFTGTTDEAVLDYAFFDAITMATGKPARYIPIRSLRQTKVGYLKLALPLFDAIDPFYDHGPTGIQRTAQAAIAEMASFDRSNSTGSCPGMAIRQYVGCGLLLGAVHGSFGAATTAATFGSISSELIMGAGGTSEAFHDHRQRGFFFVLYCNLPGYIPHEYRNKIQEAKKIADKLDAKVRLIVEANWKLATTAMAKPTERDPLIVIIKGNNIAYIDRFDCTAAETHLAQEHAVKVP